MQELVAKHGVERSVSCLLGETDDGQTPQQSSITQTPASSVAHTSQGQGSSSDQDINVLPPDAPLESILLAHSFKVIDRDTQLYITVDKENLWPTSVSFYKAMKHNPKRFKRQLVEFEGEEGVDAGALRSTFFELLIREVDQHLFEGDEKRRIPKKDWGLSSLFEIGGMMVAHSILSGGPGFPCLLPAIFHCLVTGIVDDEYIPPDMMPCKDDIPESLAYKELVEFVETVCYDAIQQNLYNLDIILTSLVVLITVGFRKLMASPVGFNRANGHQAYTHLRTQDIYTL